MNNIALIRRFAPSAYRVGMIFSLALCVVFVCAAAVNAQTPATNGKTLVVNGKLMYLPTTSNIVSATMSSGGIIRFFRYEPLGNKFAKVDYIVKTADKHQALRINESDYAMCYVRKNPQDGSNNGAPRIRFSGSIKVSSASPAPAPTVAHEEGNDNNNNAGGNDAPSQLYPILVLLQDKTGLIRLLIQTDDSTLLDYQVYNIWELLLIIPENCQNDFIELMKFYNPTLFVSRQNTLERVFNAISQSVPENPDMQKRYQQLIDDLSSDVYLKRVTAMNQIQNEGLGFLLFVQKLDLDQLEPEARVRLANLLNNVFYVNETDDVEDMAVLFSNSEYAFIPMLESDNPLFNSIAQKRLKEKLGDSFQFDKSAPDDVRAAQIQELKTALGFPQPRIIKMDEQTQRRFKDLVESILDQSYSVFKF